MEHTPTPWSAENSALCDVIYAKDTSGHDRRICEMIGPDAAANAAHIAKCVNSHLTLVAALEACFSELCHINDNQELIDMVDNALQHAKEE